MGNILGPIADPDKIPTCTHFCNSRAIIWRIHSTANEFLAEVKLWADESDLLHSQSISQQLPKSFMLVLTKVTPAEGATAQPTRAWLLEDLWPVNGVLKVSSFTKRELSAVKPALQSLIKPLSNRAVCRASVNQNRRILHLLVDRPPSTSYFAG